MKLLGALLGMFVFLGCASVQYASPSMDSQAKEFRSSPTKSTLYIYRSNVVNAAVAMDVFLNGRYLGRMRSGHFMRLELNPGQYTVTSRASNERSIKVSLQAGELYFIRQVGTFRLFQHGTDLHLVEASHGKRAVLGCALVEHQNFAE